MNPNLLKFHIQTNSNYTYKAIFFSEPDLFLVIKEYDFKEIVNDPDNNVIFNNPDNDIISKVSDLLEKNTPNDEDKFKILYLEHTILIENQCSEIYGLENFTAFDIENINDFLLMHIPDMPLLNENFYEAFHRFLN